MDAVYLWAMALMTMDRTVVRQILLSRVRQRLDLKDEMMSVQVMRCLYAELVVEGRGKGQGYGLLTFPTNTHQLRILILFSNKKNTFFLKKPPFLRRIARVTIFR